jgi:hypothetical protein
MHCRHRYKINRCHYPCRRPGASIGRCSLGPGLVPHHGQWQPRTKLSGPGHRHAGQPQLADAGHSNRRRLGSDSIHRRFNGPATILPNGLSLSEAWFGGGGSKANFQTKGELPTSNFEHPTLNRGKRGSRRMTLLPAPCPGSALEVRRSMFEVQVPLSSFRADSPIVAAGLSAEPSAIKAKPGNTPPMLIKICSAQKLQFLRRLAGSAW